MTLNDYWTSLVRTAVPMIVGALLTSRVGTFIDVAAATEATTALFALLYYGIARSFEMVAPQAGWLLGIPKVPFYNVDTGDFAAVPADQQLDSDE